MKNRPQADTLPTVLHYGEYLSTICKLEGITRNQAREKYGQFTYSQWNEILK